jgi:immunity protein 53 of polymorphic toxin system
MTSPRSTVGALRRLQQWYKAQCNGDWEHSYGVTIGTLDNPGWSLKVDLTDTPLQHKWFTEVKRDYEHQTDWLTCFFRDGVFHGACGPEKLEEMLEIFLDWSENS